MAMLCDVLRRTMRFCVSTGFGTTARKGAGSMGRGENRLLASTREHYSSNIPALEVLLPTIIWLRNPARYKSGILRPQVEK